MGEPIRSAIVAPRPNFIACRVGENAKRSAGFATVVVGLVGVGGMSLSGTTVGS